MTAKLETAARETVKRTQRSPERLRPGTRIRARRPSSAEQTPLLFTWRF